MIRTTMICAALLCAVLQGCASVHWLENLQPGVATLDAVRARQKPDAEWLNANGTLTLEYDKRSTAQNLMLDFDAKGSLLAVRPVLSRETMAQLRTAMTRQEVQRVLGKPWYVSQHHITGGEVWEWPLGAQLDFGQDMIMVQFHPSTDGVVKFGTSVRYR